METPALAMRGPPPIRTSPSAGAITAASASTRRTRVDFWSGAEYSTSNLSGYPANWATWISQFAIAPTVISSTPAAGSIVTGTAPTTFSLTFSEPIDPTSITAGSFQVNGIKATSA